MLDRAQCVLPIDEPGHNDEMHEMAREGFRCKLHLRLDVCAYCPHRRKVAAVRHARRRGTTQQLMDCDLPHPRHRRRKHGAVGSFSLAASPRILTSKSCNEGRE